MTGLEGFLPGPCRPFAPPHHPQSTSMQRPNSLESISTMNSRFTHSSLFPLPMPGQHSYLNYSNPPPSPEPQRKFHNATGAVFLTSCVEYFTPLFKTFKGSYLSLSKPRVPRHQLWARFISYIVSQENPNASHPKPPAFVQTLQAPFQP